MLNEQHKKNIIKNGVWEFLYRMVSLIVPLVIRTIIIWKFGVEYLGLNNLFASVLQIISMAELGFGEAVVYNLYKPIAENNTVMVNSLMSYYKKIYRRIGIFILGAGLMFMPFLNYIIKDDIPADVNIYILYAMSLLTTSLSYLCFAYKSVLPNASQRKDILSKISIFSTLLKYFIQLAVLFLTKNLYLYFGADIVATVINNLLIAYFVKKNFPNYNERGTLDSKVKKEIFSKVKGLMVYKLSGKTKNAVDSIVLSSCLGLVIVGRYGNYYYILNNLVVLLSSITLGAQATIGNRMAINHEKDNYEDFMNLTFLYNWLTSICCVCLLCLYQHFMELWVGKENTFPFYMVICFCVYFFFLSNCEVRNAYINAAGLWWENRFRAIGGAIFNFVFNIILVNLLGVLGVVIASLISIIIFDVFFTSRTLFKYCFKKFSVCKYLKWWIKQIINVVLICILMYYICGFIKNNIWGFLTKGILCFLGSNLFLWIFNKNEKEYNFMLSFFMGKISKKK